MKKNTTKIFIAAIFLTISGTAYAQEGRVGINTSTPAATLDVVASPSIPTRIDGFIAPRLKGSELNAKNGLYGTDQDGAIVYVTEALAGVTYDKTTNVTSIGYYYFDKTQGTAGRWMKIANPVAAAVYQEPWNVWGTTTPATTNTQNIYQNGRVGIKKTTDFITGSDLDVKGSIRGGNAKIYSSGTTQVIVGSNSLAFGSASEASGEGTIAIGSNSIASKKNSFALGNGAKTGYTDASTTTSTGDHSYAIGEGAITGGNNAYALGKNVIATGNNSFAGGNGSLASGEASFAFGYIQGSQKAIASGAGAVAFARSTAGALESFAIGDGNIIENGANQSFTFGQSNLIKGIAGNKYMNGAFGRYNEITGVVDYAFGSYNIIDHEDSVSLIQDEGGNLAVGLYNKVYSTGQTFAMGKSNIATKSAVRAAAIGESNTVSGRAAIALGYENTSSAYASTAVGFQNIASSQGAFAGGYQSDATNYNAFAYGNDAQASGASSAAFGVITKAQGDYSFTQGYGTNATNTSEAALGQYNRPVTSAIFQVGDGNTSTSQSNLISAIKGGVPADSWMAIGSGTTNPIRVASEKLRVYGGVNATSYAVGSTTLTVPDYVFQKYYTGNSTLKGDYKFVSNLYDVENYLKENHHLPGVTSASEIKKAGFYNLEDMQMQSLEKVEELYLHTIEQQKQIDELKDIVKQQQKQIDQLLKK